MAAYEYARDSQLPPPYYVTLLHYIDRFGVRAVTGRDVLSAGEMSRMMVSEAVIKAYRSRSNSDNWAKWTQDNPQAAKLLTDIETNGND